MADAIQLVDGRVLRGRITSYDGKQVGVKLDNGVVTRLKVTQLAPSLRYRLRVDRLPPTSAEQHYALGTFCARHGLATQARKHLEQARKLEPALGELVALRLGELDELGAELLYRRILALGKAGKYREALSQIKGLRRRYPGAFPVRWAEELAPSFKQAIADRERDRRRKRGDRANKRELALELQREQQRQHLRALAQGTLKEAQQHRAEALRAEGNGQESRAAVQFKEASSKYEKALDAAARLRRKVTERRQLQQALDWQQQIVHAWALLAIDAAHLRARQGNWKDAHRWLELAIRLEPLNADARRLHKLVGKRRIVKSLQKLTNAKPIIRNR